MKMGSGPQPSRPKQWRVTPPRIFLCLGIVCYLWIDFQLSFLIEESGVVPTDPRPVPRSQRTTKKHSEQHSSTKDYLVSSSPSSSLQSQSAAETSKASRLGYIHIGKTGGSTISTLLRNGCHSFLPKPCRNVTNETVVSKLVENYYHVPDFHSLPDSRDASFVMSVRDVYDRTVSAFVYNLPSNTRHYGRAHNIVENKKWKRDNLLAYQCFPSLEDFAALQTLGDSEKCGYKFHHSLIVGRNCTKLACAVLHGKVRNFNHLFFNYRNILRTKFPRAVPARKLYVIRQEFLWDDWARVNAMVGESEGMDAGVGDDSTTNRNKNNKNIDNKNKNNNNNNNNKNENENNNESNEINVRDVSGYGEMVRNSRNISEKGRRQLCTALTNEYAAYFAILRKAENVDAERFEAARAIAVRNCPDLGILSSESFEPTGSEKELWEPDPDEDENDEEKDEKEEKDEDGNEDDDEDENKNEGEVENENENENENEDEDEGENKNDDEEENEEENENEDENKNDDEDEDEDDDENKNEDEDENENEDKNSDEDENENDDEEENENEDKNSDEDENENDDEEENENDDENPDENSDEDDSE